jgi:3-methyladenine DNA glycosylase AlkD
VDHIDLAEIRVDLEAIAEPERIDVMVAYMKGHFEFLGVTTAKRRPVTKWVLAAARKAEPDSLLRFADRCWAEPEREFHYLGTEVLRAGAKHLRQTDLPHVRGFITATPWWDTVDGLAVHAVGALVRNHQDLVHEMDEWIESDDIWIARTAIIHQLMYKERTDANRLFTYCEMRMDHANFFIRKAIGWALRQYARTDGDAVVAFVNQHEDDLSGLSKREALKHL